MEESNKYKTSINKQGYVLRKSHFTEYELNNIKKELTVKPIQIPGYGTDDTEEHYVYRENKSKLYVPRYYGYTKFGNPDENNMPHPEKVNFKFSGSLRNNQLPIIESYMKSLETKSNDKGTVEYLNGGGIISAGCGVGKTTMALYIASQLKLKTLIVVHKEFLMNQWRERIKQFIPDASIGIIQGKVYDSVDKDIVLGMLKSIGMKDYPELAFYGFGLVIYDECHHTSARMFSNALRKTNFNFTLGLSATPKRKDGLTKVFLWYLGNIVYKQIDTKKEIVKVLMYKYYNKDQNYSKVLLNYMGKPNNATMISNIANCEKRNKFIFSLLDNLIKDNRKILILTERLSEVKWFYDTIVDNTKITVGKYIGGMKQRLLDESEKCQILVGTYTMIEEGFDCKDLDTLIMATPKSSIEQSVGRILRKKIEDRLNTSTIIDIWDQFGSYQTKGYTRIKYYKKKHYQVEYINVDDNSSTTKIEIIKNKKEDEQYIQDDSDSDDEQKKIISQKVILRFDD
jgi:superfamily II DNA or RNA helicase